VITFRNNDEKTVKSDGQHIPLAERMRPRSFDRFYGQEHLLGPGKILTELIESGHLVSIIFWGRPAPGKPRWE